jgi:dihydroflavonol-4-reductase
MIDVVPWHGREPEPSEWPVLVTGAGGFVGGHVARELAKSGHLVRGLARRPPQVEDGDPAIEWLIGDLLDSETRRRALTGVRAVIHAASWVSLGADHGRVSQAVNVDATRQLLAESTEAGVERFVYTSTLYTLAAGTEARPADEFSAWNLESVDSAYTQTKRQAEWLVLEASRPGFLTIALCPGMVLGPRDTKPTSTKIIRVLSRAFVAVLPGGGIPIVDAGLLAVAHRRALVAGGAGHRYAVVGQYLSYHDMAALVSSITGHPRWVLRLPDPLERLVSFPVDWVAPFVRKKWPNLSRQLIRGGFLGMHVSGERANVCFGLAHPPALESISRSL